MSSPPYRLSVLTNSISRMNGGIFDAMRNLTLAIAAEGRYLPAVFSTQDLYTESDQPLWRDVTTKIFSVRGPRILGYAPGLAAALESSYADILHIHGIWMYPSVAASHWSQGRRLYVVSPHGLLKPRALRNSRWKKRIAALLYEDKHLRGAACLHALNVAEADALRRYGLKNPICVIPNGINLHCDKTPSKPMDGKTVLYLGRFHPLKGLRNLIEAWRQVRNEAAPAEWRLTLAGWDQNRHRAELEQIVDRLGVRSSVEFLGPQFDQEKDRCLAAASAFILPSQSEGLPVSILEAWSWKLPVLMTYECNLPEGVEAGAAIVMEPEAKSIAAALRRLFSMPDAERKAMGDAGRCLVEQRFQWQCIGESMTQVYDWILGHGPRPDCVLF